MLGIEINPFAAELARVSVWIGEIQWMREHGFDASRNPILKPLDTIRCHDALLDDGTEYGWPPADVIIGNPPFLGNRKMIRRLGQGYVDQLRATFSGQVAGASDLVVYWFFKAHKQIQAEKCRRVGLVATQAIRRGASRQCLKSIVENGRIYEAWSDGETEPVKVQIFARIACLLHRREVRHREAGRPPSCNDSPRAIRIS